MGLESYLRRYIDYKLIGFLLFHFELIFTICQRFDDKEVNTTELEANQL